MKKYLKARKAKGFTLVELLIVLIIIGILAGALLLVAGAGQDKAKATKIASDLRSAKAAALMYYADKNSWPDTPEKLKPYMDNQALASILYVASNDTDKTWYIGEAISDDAAVDNTKVRGKLQELRQNQNVALYGGNSTTTAPGSTDLYESTHTAVWMLVATY